MIMSHTQINNFVENELQPLADRGIHPITCVQTAGDVIIVPEGWGHGVLNIQVGGVPRTRCCIDLSVGFCCDCD